MLALFIENETAQNTNQFLGTRWDLDILWTHCKNESVAKIDSRLVTLTMLCGNMPK